MKRQAPIFKPCWYAFFGKYLRRYFAKHFNAVRASSSGPPPKLADGATIIYTNHPSWWDPILFILVGSIYFPKHEHYGPMEKEALEKYAFFKKLGAFGIEKEGRQGAADFLRASKHVFDRPGSVLWLTAEGEFSDPRQRPLALRAGLAHLVRKYPEVNVIPLAIEYPFWTERLPEALLRFGEPVQANEFEGSTDTIQRGLEQALEETMDTLASEARSKDAGAFMDVVAGRQGVGLVYDAWRRTKALVQGKRFSARHSDLAD